LQAWIQVPDTSKKWENGSDGAFSSNDSAGGFDTNNAARGFGTINVARGFAAMKVQKKILEAPTMLLLLGNGSSVDDSAGTHQ